MRFRIIASLFIAIGFCLQSSAQYSFDNGLYISFEDLKGNRSVKDLPYRQELIKSKNGISRYGIFYQGKYKKIKGIYCYVNNNHIYLNSKKFGRKGYYLRSHFVGRYAYFEDRFGKDDFSYSRGVPSSNGPAVESKIWGILLDMETGKVKKATRRNLKKLLANHPELWQQYLDGSKSSTEVKEIIVWLNSSNK